MQTFINNKTDIENTHYAFKLKNLGLVDYQHSLSEMQNFTQARDNNTSDEVWLLEHPSIYTQGVAGRPEHILRDNGIDVIQSDRGGQVTYHGPGQLIIYLLLDLDRLGLDVKLLVKRTEQGIINYLKSFDINGHLKLGAPGVYVGDKKIASIGLKIKNSYTYHGISFNFSMDLSPFNDINTCGYKDLEVTQLEYLIGTLPKKDLAHKQLAKAITNSLRGK